MWRSLSFFFLRDQTLRRLLLSAVGFKERIRSVPASFPAWCLPFSAGSPFLSPFSPSFLLCFLPPVLPYSSFCRFFFFYLVSRRIPFSLSGGLVSFPPFLFSVLQIDVPSPPPCFFYPVCSLSRARLRVPSLQAGKLTLLYPSLPPPQENSARYPLSFFLLCELLFLCVRLDLSLLHEAIFSKPLAPLLPFCP